MNPFYAGAVEALRRRLARHQGRPTHSSEPLWRLLAEEVWLAVRWLAGRRLLQVWLAALLVGLTVGIGFSDAVPGPVLPRHWRWMVAATLAVVVGVWLHLRVRREVQR